MAKLGQGRHYGDTSAFSLQQEILDNLILVVSTWAQDPGSTTDQPCDLGKTVFSSNS